MTALSWFARASSHPVDLSAQWARVQPETRVNENDWRARLADGTREPLPANMTWLHPAAGTRL